MQGSYITYTESSTVIKIRVGRKFLHTIWYLDYHSTFHNTGSPLPTDVPQEKQTEKCLIFFTDSPFSSMLLFLSGRTDKVILNAKKLI